MSKKARIKDNETKKKKGPRRKEEKPSRLGYFLKRALAFILDWYFSTVLVNLAISLSQGLFNNEIQIVQNFSSYTFGQTLVMLLLVILTSFFYYVYIPVKVWKGQTVMMHVLQLKIVGLDGKELAWKQVLFRYVVGCLLIEGAFYSCSTITWDAIITYFFKNNQQLADIIVGGILGIIALVSAGMAVFDKKHNQLIHDRISKSEVIDLYDGGNHAL